jgi:hypothetical protein
MYSCIPVTKNITDKERKLTKAILAAQNSSEIHTEINPIWKCLIASKNFLLSEVYEHKSWMFY